MSLCPKHGIPRRQRFSREGNKQGWRCSQCDSEYNKKAWANKTSGQRAIEAARAKEYRRTKLTDDQKRRYNEQTKRARLDLSLEERQERGRRAYLKYTYGITVEEYDALFEQQGGQCAVCGSPPNGRALDVDHCHDSGLVRGLLCNSCNAGIGLLGDDPKRLRVALEYLTQLRLVTLKTNRI